MSGGEGVWRIGLPGWYEPGEPEGGKTPGKTPAVAKAVAKGASRCMGWGWGWSVGEVPITAPSPSIVGDSPCIGEPLWGDDDPGGVEWEFTGRTPKADAPHAVTSLATPLADTGAVTGAVPAAACAWCVACAVVPATAAALVPASPALLAPATGDGAA